MNSLNQLLWRFVKVAIYLLIVIGIIGLLTLTIIIPQWVKSTEVLVPNLIGMTLFQADPSLREVGLSPENPIREARSEKPKGEVIEQDPPANFSIKSHHSVKITVSNGSDLSPIPSVIGKSVDAAYETLQTNGFRTYSVAHVHSENYFPDTVIAQSPAENTKHKRSELINLLVSLGKKPQNIQLPNLINQPLSEVLKTLQNLGMKVEIKYSSHPTIPEGHISGHKQLVQIGDQITLEVSGKRDNTENKGRWLNHKHIVDEKGNLARNVKIVIIDEYGEREFGPTSYAPGTIIDLEKSKVRVFGPTLVIVFEDSKKVYERYYQ